VPLGQLLRERYRCTIAVENDANAAALGEAHYGAGRLHGESRNLSLISVGRGIGGGLVANGELVGGATGAAGEAGHMVFRPEGKVCSCGARGHFEAYAGAACIEAKFRRIVADGTPTLVLDLAGGRPEALTLAMIFEAADKGDDAAAVVVEEIRLALGTLAANVATLVNPALLVIGGTVVKGRRSLVLDCAAAVARSAMRAAARACRVVEAVLWENGAILGSAELVRRERARGRPA
jgi:glucokinase